MSAKQEGTTGTIVEHNTPQAGSFRYGGASGRRTAILQRLRKHGYVSMSDLGLELEVSDRTIRRDLADMADEGVVQLVPGGATLPIGSRYPAQPFLVRRVPEVDVKRRLARAAVALVSSGDAVAIDAGTTAGCVAEALAEVAPLTVITHSLEVMEHLSDQAGVSLISVGGSYDVQSRSFLGPMTRENLKGMHATIAFLGCSGTSDAEFACSSQPDAEIKQALARMASRRVVVASSTVFQRTAPIAMFEFGAVETVVTDDRLADGDRLRLEATGVELILVDVSESAADASRREPASVDG